MIARERSTASPGSTVETCPWCSGISGSMRIGGICGPSPPGSRACSTRSVRSPRTPPWTARPGSRCAGDLERIKAEMAGIARNRERWRSSPAAGATSTRRSSCRAGCATGSRWTRHPGSGPCCRCSTSSTPPASCSSWTGRRRGCGSSTRVRSAARVRSPSRGTGGPAPAPQARLRRLGRPRREPRPQQDGGARQAALPHGSRAAGRPPPTGRFELLVIGGHEHEIPAFGVPAAAACAGASRDPSPSTRAPRPRRRQGTGPGDRRPLRAGRGAAPGGRGGREARRGWPRRRRSRAVPVGRFGDGHRAAAGPRRRRGPGVVCEQSGWLAEAGDTCPLCGDPTRKTEDVIDELDPGRRRRRRHRRARVRRHHSARAHGRRGPALPAPAPAGRAGLTLRHHIGLVPRHVLFGVNGSNWLFPWASRGSEHGKPHVRSRGPVGASFRGESPHVGIQGRGRGVCRRRFVRRNDRTGHQPRFERRRTGEPDRRCRCRCHCRRPRTTEHRPDHHRRHAPDRPPVDARDLEPARRPRREAHRVHQQPPPLLPRPRRDPHRTAQPQQRCAQQRRPPRWLQGPGATREPRRDVVEAERRLPDRLHRQAPQRLGSDRNPAAGVDCVRPRPQEPVLPPST